MGNPSFQVAAPPLFNAGFTYYLTGLSSTSMPELPIEPSIRTRFVQALVVCPGPGNEEYCSSGSVGYGSGPPRFGVLRLGPGNKEEEPSQSEASAECGSIVGPPRYEMLSLLPRGYCPEMEDEI